MLVHCRVTPSIRFAGTHLHTWVERGTVRVKCLAQEHNTMSPARARTQTAWSGDEHTNPEATAPSTIYTYKATKKTYECWVLFSWSEQRNLPPRAVFFSSLCRLCLWHCMDEQQIRCLEAIRSKHAVKKSRDIFQVWVFKMHRESDFFGSEFLFSRVSVLRVWVFDLATHSAGLHVNVKIKTTLFNEFLEN